MVSSGHMWVKSIIIIYLGLWSLTTSTVYLCFEVFLWNRLCVLILGLFCGSRPLQLASFFEELMLQSDPFQTFLITFSRPLPCFHDQLSHAVLTLTIFKFLALMKNSLSYCPEAWGVIGRGTCGLDVIWITSNLMKNERGRALCQPLYPPPLRSSWIMSVGFKLCLLSWITQDVRSNRARNQGQLSAFPWLYSTHSTIMPKKEKDTTDISSTCLFCQIALFSNCVSLM